MLKKNYQKLNISKRFEKQIFEHRKIHDPKQWKDAIYAVKNEFKKLTITLVLKS